MYSKADVTNFIQTYGALILSIYAIGQVWVIALWKKLRKGKIDIFEMGWIEVGFAAFGSTITLNGTLRAQRKDVFVQEVSLSLTRESDGATFALNWIAFKSPQVKIGDPTATTVEIPSGINVRMDEPVRYSIVFCNKSIQAQINRRLHAVVNEWKHFLNERRDKIQKALRSGTVSEDDIVEQYFTEFIKASELTRATRTFHDTMNWWEAGRYRVKMEVKASSPDKTFSEEWMFSLEDDVRDGLRQNSLATLREICLGKLDYFSASLDYIKEKN
jgi:hypothetical protein